VSAALAAVDLGTNTVRLLVADADPVGGLTPRAVDQVVARLGEGLRERGRLAPAAVDRTLRAVRRCRDRALALGADEILLVATAAVRQAENGDALLARLAAEPRVRARVVSGAEEARLTLLGAAWGLGGRRDRFGLVDVGGGSTEFAVAEGDRVLGAVSVTVGVVDLAERFFARDPVDAGELRACREHVARRLRDEVWPALGPVDPVEWVATAGTPTTLAALDLALARYDAARVRGHRLARARIDRLVAWLAALPLAARARLPGLEPGRADVLVPGALVLAAALAGLGLEAFTVADTGLREGILLDAVGWRPSAAPPAGRPSAADRERRRQ
jgi:exopolyphosphatase/guanosine-5'-triphosphate,3'-diphosphate pyrophosphatase